MGIERFEREMLSLPQLIRDSVIKSLRNRSNDYGTEFVLPRQLLNWIV
jgi:hypothetical protein